MRFDSLIAIFIAAWALVLFVPLAIVTTVGTLAAVVAALLLASSPRRRAREAEARLLRPSHGVRKR
jgi:hypothetical protein